MFMVYLPIYKAHGVAYGAALSAPVAFVCSPVPVSYFIKCISGSRKKGTRESGCTKRVRSSAREK